jgi:hypothetical protein
MFAGSTGTISFFLERLRVVSCLSEAGKPPFQAFVHARFLRLGR